MGSSFDLARAAGSAAKPAGLAAPVAVEETPAPSAEGGAPANSTLVLVPPQPVVMVDPQEAPNSVHLEPSTIAKLDAMVADYVVAISQLDTKDPKFEARMSDVRNLGDDEIKASTQFASRLVGRPIGSMKKGGSAGSIEVADNLAQLRRQVDSLDPGHQGDLFGTRKLLGMISLGDPMVAYFAKYQSSQGHINAIFSGLESGKAALAADSADLDAEKANLWQTMERLREYLYLAQKLDAFLSGRLEKMEAADPERARIFKEHVLFHVRKKSQDLSMQMAVSVQGYLAVDVIRANNSELARGVDRATTDHALGAEGRRDRGAGPGRSEDRAGSDFGTRRRGAGQAVRRGERAGDGARDRSAEAANGVQRRLRHDGRDRHLQGEIARKHEPDDLRALGAGRQGAGATGQGQQLQPVSRGRFRGQLGPGISEAASGACHSAWTSVDASPGISATSPSIAAGRGAPGVIAPAISLKRAAATGSSEYQIHVPWRSLMTHPASRRTLRW